MDTHCRIEKMTNCYFMSPAIFAIHNIFLFAIISLPSSFVIFVFLSIKSDSYNMQYALFICFSCLQIFPYIIFHRGFIFLMHYSLGTCSCIPSIRQFHPISIPMKIQVCSDILIEADVLYL